MLGIKRPSNRDSDAAFKVMLNRLNAWEIPDAAVDTVHDAARTSLFEVKALTEYEDGKVSRLLTVVAFLSAVVGAVFTRFASEYGWPRLADAAIRTSWLLPFATYVAFFVYVVLVTGAVFVLLRAIRPKFNVPATWKGDELPERPRSMLFYAGILDVEAPRWADAFEQLAGNDGQNLKRCYAKCYIAEAYLVAGKVADKLRVVGPGVDGLLWAMGVLLAFFVLFAATTATVEPTSSPSSSTHPAENQTQPSPARTR